MAHQPRTRRSKPGTWYEDIKETDACGPVRHDSRIEYDDVEKLIDHFGDEFPRVKAVDIYTNGTYCYGVGFHYQGGYDPGVHLVQPLPDGVECERFELDDDEYIVKMKARTGAWVDEIELITNKGRDFDKGGQGGGANDIDF